MKFEFTVAEADAGRRLDRFLSAHLAPQLGGLPASRIQRLLRKGDVKLNGKRASAGDTVKAGDVIVAHHPAPESGQASSARGAPLWPAAAMAPRAEDARPNHQTQGRRTRTAGSSPPKAKAGPRRSGASTPAEGESGTPRSGASAPYEGPGIPVLYEGEGIVVVNKPPEVSCDHGEAGGPGLLQWAEEKYSQQIAAGDMRPATPHRLDIGTSGAVCVTLTAAASEVFRKALEEGRVEKRYWVLVWGRPLEEEFELDIPLRRLPHSPRNRPKVVAAPSTSQGQSANTRFRWIAAGPEASLLEAEPFSGRTHQIRAHCLAHGLPVVGDPRYGDPKRDQAVGLNTWLRRQCLHARSLRLDDEQRGFSVNAALTRDLERVFRSLGVELDN